jgi:hypothetical protein
MKQSDIRTNLHQLIDEIENDQLLIKLYDLLSKSKDQNEGDLWNQLSDEQRKELLISESESKYKENLVDHEKQKAKHKKWL